MNRLLIWFNPKDDCHKLGSYADYVSDCKNIGKATELEILYELDSTVSKLADKIIKQLNGEKIAITI